MVLLKLESVRDMEKVLRLGFSGWGSFAAPALDPWAGAARRPGGRDGAPEGGPGAGS